MLLTQGGNGVTPQVAHCEHVSFGNCGECEKPRTPDQKKIAELEDKLAAMERFLNVRNEPNGAPAGWRPVCPECEKQGKPCQPIHGFIATVHAKPVKLDLGCGTLSRRTEMKNWTREQGWTGVDIQPSDGADVVCDLSSGVWPWPDNSVDEVNCHHMLEHIPGKREDWTGGVKAITYPRAHFFNELWRVLKPGGKGSFVTPYWGSCRAYGDVTHEWPPIGEMSYLYLDKEWRKTQAPHDNFYACDFTHGLGYAPGSHLVGRTPEFVQEAIRDHKEGAGDLLATLVARKG